MYMNTYAQEGNIFLKHYSHVYENADSATFSIREDEHGILYFANSKGLLAYDGAQWKLIPTDNIPLVIEPNKRGQIYAGLRNEFGYFKKGSDGEYAFHKVSDKISESGEIHTIHISGNKIYFCNSKYIYSYSTRARIL